MTRYSVKMTSLDMPAPRRGFLERLASLSSGDTITVLDGWDTPVAVIIPAGDYRPEKPPEVPGG